MPRPSKSCPSSVSRPTYKPSSSFQTMAVFMPLDAPSGAICAVAARAIKNGSDGARDGTSIAEPLNRFPHCSTHPASAMDPPDAMVAVNEEVLPELEALAIGLYPPTG